MWWQPVGVGWVAATIWAKLQVSAVVVKRSPEDSDSKIRFCLKEDRNRGRLN